MLTDRTRREMAKRRAEAVLKGLDQTASQKGSFKSGMKDQEARRQAEMTLDLIADLESLLLELDVQRAIPKELAQ